MKLEATIEKLGGEGVGIAHVAGKATFVPYGVPGDKLLVKVVNDTKSYYKTEIVEIIKPSASRRQPPCKHFGLCGGCSHQNIYYPKQLEYKHALLLEIFRKFTQNGLVVEPVTPAPSDFEYRNKLQMQCTAVKNGKIGAGFYKVKSHDVVVLDGCPLHSGPMNKLVKSVVSTLNQFNVTPYSEKLHKGMVRHIAVRESHKTGDMMLTIVSNYPMLFNQNLISKVLFSKNKSLKSFYIYHNPHDTNVIFEDSCDVKLKDNRSPLKKVFGDDCIVDSINGVNFRVSPLSFFQVNTAQAENMAKLIDKLLDTGDRSKKYSVIDSYSGIGTLSIGLAHKFKSILAIEIVEQACALARQNAAAAGARNYHIKKGDTPEILSDLIAREGEESFRNKYRAIILDPPRAGLSDEMVKLLCDIKIDDIVYISCNPHTQARDVEKLVNEGGYKITRCVPFDMFPHTFHIENIMKLEQERGNNNE